MYIEIVVICKQVVEWLVEWTFIPSGQGISVKNQNFIILLVRKKRMDYLIIKVWKLIERLINESICCYSISPSQTN